MPIVDTESFLSYPLIDERKIVIWLNGVPKGGRSNEKEAGAGRRICKGAVYEVEAGWMRRDMIVAWLERPIEEMGEDNVL